MTTTTTTPAPLEPGRWVLDPVHCTVEFTARHMGISRVRGRFTRFTAEVLVAPGVADVAVSAEVDLSSVDTGNAQRDEHLRGTDFFDVEGAPTMTFASTGLTPVGDDVWELGGELTVNGCTRRQVLEVRFHGVEVFPGDGTTHAGFESTGELRRSDFEIDFNVPLGAGGFVISDRIGIELDIQLLPAAQLAGTS